MKLTLKRLYKKSNYTIGKLYVDDEYFCDTVEDTDRGLTSNMTLDEIKKRKVYGKTAIPTGRYKIELQYSQKFKKILPLLISVLGFLGIYIHSGNTAEDSLGCIIVGENKIKGGVINSRKTMKRLMEKLQGQREIYIMIE